MKNSFCWLQLQSPDTDQVKTFYGKLFDWTLKDPASTEMPYIHIETAEGPGGGIMRAEADMPSNWLPYVQVQNLEEHTKKAKDLGATILIPPTPIPSGGSYSVLQDPGGAAIGLYQPPSS